MTTHDEEHVDPQHHRLVDLDGGVERGNRRELELAFVLEGSDGAAPAGAKVPIEDRHRDADGIRAEREQLLHVLDPRHHGLPGQIVDAAAAGALEVVVASRVRCRFLN